MVVSRSQNGGTWNVPFFRPHVVGIIKLFTMEILALFKVVWCFPDKTPTMIGESIDNMVFIFWWESLKQIPGTIEGKWGPS